MSDRLRKYLATFRDDFGNTYTRQVEAYNEEDAWQIALDALTDDGITGFLTPLEIREIK